jgi:hypothetical protein
MTNYRNFLAGECFHVWTSILAVLRALSAKIGHVASHNGNHAHTRGNTGRDDAFGVHAKVREKGRKMAKRHLSTPSDHRAIADAWPRRCWGCVRQALTLGAIQVHESSFNCADAGTIVAAARQFKSKRRRLN